MTNFKISVFEQDGAEYGVPVEYDLTSALKKVGVEFVLGDNTDIVYNYLSNGDVNYVEFFNSTSHITANRIARTDITYSSGDPTQEVFKLYDVDGTSILNTVTFTYTYVSGDLTEVSTSVV